MDITLIITQEIGLGRTSIICAMLHKTVEKEIYQLSLKDTSKEKEMIDHLRCRNGNLEIMVKNQETTTTSL